MNAALNLLVIEDQQADFLLLERHLRTNGLAARCRQVTDALDLAACLRRESWDAVLSDYSVPGLPLSESVALIGTLAPDVPVILVSAYVGEEKALELLKLGVTDFILKDNLPRLVPALRRALQLAMKQRAWHAAERALHEKDQLLREMSALAHIGAWEYDPATGKCLWTDEVARIYEVDPDTEARKDFVFSFHHGDWRQEIETVLSDAIRRRDGKSFDLELEIETVKGKRRWVRMVFQPPALPGYGTQLRGSIQDITERKNNEALLFEQMERAEVTLHSIGDAVITTDARGKIDYLNPVAQELTGWSLQKALQHPLTEVLILLDMDNGRPTEKLLATVLMQGEICHLPADCVLIRHDGKRLAIEDSAAPIRSRNGSIIGAVLVFRDVTASQEIAARFGHQATHDALTGLPNRILTADRLQQAIGAAQRDNTFVGVLFLDLDRFKNINESLGYASGDLILEQVAARLQAITRAADTVSRLGGDEFMIIMPGASQLVHFGALAQTILHAVSAPYFVRQLELTITFSIGISIYPHDGADATTLIKNADVAMTHAKEAGRDNYQFYAAEMNSRAAERLQLEGQLRHALSRGEFVVHYQPKVETQSHELIGAEALIRWNHPQAGMLGPANFIAIAEESGLIVPIGRWVTQEVCRQNLAWQNSGLNCVPISVNLSAIQFRNKALVDSMRELLQDCGLPPHLLELELTESVIMQGSDAVIAKLRGLKELGIHLSIDDFGTGYSSLNYLKRFPIDTLKIDQSFVRDIAHDESDGAIIKAIISMAHSLKMSVIAEGVETREQLAFLETHHCDEIQGYYFSRPLPATRFEELLHAPRMQH